MYRINDSSESVEAAQDRKHMFDGVCNGGQLQRRRKNIVTSDIMNILQHSFTFMKSADYPRRHK